MREESTATEGQPVSCPNPTLLRICEVTFPSQPKNVQQDGLPTQDSASLPVNTPILLNVAGVKLPSVYSSLSKSGLGFLFLEISVWDSCCIEPMLQAPRT